MKIGIFLMTEKGFVVIKSLVERNLTHLLQFVCIGQDKGVLNDYSLEIVEICRENEIPYFLRNDLKIIPDAYYYVAISWRWIIYKDNLIVLHDSLLPKYRGFAPLVNALKSGEKVVGVTALWASAEYDKGNIIIQESMNLSYPIKIKDAISKIAVLYQNIVVRLFQSISDRSLNDGTKQNESEASYSLWLDEHDYFIRWERDSKELARFVDACGFPYNGAKTYLGDNIIQVVEVEHAQDVNIVNRVPGKLIFIKDGFPYVVCGNGLIIIKEAYYLDSGKSILPFNKMRTRFLNENTI